MRAAAAPEGTPWLWTLAFGHHEDRTLDWTFTLRNHSGYSLVRFKAGAARAETLAVVHKPEPGNPAHTEVIGKKTQGVANHLVAASTWAHQEPL
jgi:hypothetical protein